jgi:hypothetical protein
MLYLGIVLKQREGLQSFNTGEGAIFRQFLQGALFNGVAAGGDEMDWTIHLVVIAKKGVRGRKEIPKGMQFGNSCGMD